MNKEGEVSMKKFIPLIIVALCTQLIAMFMWGQYVWLSKLSMGGVSGTPLGQIQPTLWFVFVLEIILLAYCFQKNNEGFKSCGKLLGRRS